MKVLYNAKIITMADPMVIENGSVTIDQGQIVDIQDGFKPAIPSKGLECIDLQGRTIMPSLVNSHIHFTIWRSFVMAASNNIRIRPLNAFTR